MQAHAQINVPNPLDYASPDTAALGEDEIVWAEHAMEAHGPRGCGTAVFRVGLGAFVVIAGVIFVMSGPGRDVAALGALFLSIAGGAALLWARDAVTGSTTASTLRVSNQRIVQRVGKGVSQVAHRDLVRLTRQREAGRRKTLVDAKLEDRGEGELAEMNDGDVAMSLVGVVLSDAAPPRLHEAIRCAAACGLSERWVSRTARWIWRTDMNRTQPSNADGVPFAQVIDGERILWTGAPRVTWKRDLSRTAIRWLKSCYWTFAAAAIAALPIYYPALRNGGMIVLSIVAGLVLLGQAGNYLVAPVKTHRRLRRTEYTLTNWRAIVTVRRAQQTLETSNFLDTQTRVDLQMDSDGLGTLTLGDVHFEQSPNVKRVYDIAVATIATCRWAEPPLPAARIAETGACHQEAVAPAEGSSSDRTT